MRDCTWGSMGICMVKVSCIYCTVWQGPIWINLKISWEILPLEYRYRLNPILNPWLNLPNPFFDPEGQTWLDRTQKSGQTDRVSPKIELGLGGKAKSFQIRKKVAKTERSLNLFVLIWYFFRNKLHSISYYVLVLIIGVTVVHIIEPQFITIINAMETI